MCRCFRIDTAKSRSNPVGPGHPVLTLLLAWAASRPHTPEANLRLFGQTLIIGSPMREPDIPRPSYGNNVVVPIAGHELLRKPNLFLLGCDTRYGAASSPAPAVGRIFLFAAIACVLCGMVGCVRQIRLTPAAQVSRPCSARKSGRIATIAIVAALQLTTQPARRSQRWPQLRLRSNRHALP